MAKKGSKRSTRSAQKRSEKGAGRGEGQSRPDAADRRESGQPGGGQGRRDEVGRSGVYAPGADNIPSDAEVRMAGSWGGGDYNESGGSGLVYRDGQVLGGLTAGREGEPAVDTHSSAVRPKLPSQARDEGAKK
jgi:hypothetical protein